MDNTVWQHAIHNACQDQTLPDPLFHPTTIFNIHHNSHFTTLITNNNTYYYYDSLNLQLPPAVDKIHGTLRQWYMGLHIAPPSCVEKRRKPLSKVPPGKQMDGHVACTCSLSTLRPYTKDESLHSSTPNTTQNHSLDPTSNTSSRGNSTHS